MLLAAHVHPAISMALGAVALGAIVWYWKRLDRPGVPETRRRIRRASMLAMVVGIFVFVRALSFVDEHGDPSNYAVAWAMGLLLVLIVLSLALLDVFNNMRIHRRARLKVLEEERARLTAALRIARNQRSPGRGDDKRSSSEDGAA